MEHILGELIWIVFWAGFFGTSGLKMWIHHRERELELRAMGRLPDRADNAQMRTLHDEVALLRDTTTQYDLTVEHTLAEIKQRLAALEDCRNYSTGLDKSRPAAARMPQNVEAIDKTAFIGH